MLSLAAALAALVAAAPSPVLITPGAAEKALAAKFAPLVMLAQGEPYLPSSIEYYDPHVALQCKGNVAHGSLFDIQGTLPADVEKQKSECFFTTKEKLNGPDAILGWFKGQDPTRTPVPVYVTFYKSIKNGALNIQYLTFYPYNWGKNVCLSLAPKDHCMAKRHQMDNHVADWEGMTVQVQGDKLVGVRVGAHAASSIGYTFTAAAKGNCADEGGSGALNSVSPLKCVELRDGHPVVYSAWGSHGIWGTAGNHNYQTLPTGERLNDSTSKGKEWRTWQALSFVDESKWPFKFKGRWGNSHESSPNNRNACKLSPVPHKLCAPAGIPTDEYELNDGPTTPDLMRDADKL